MGSGDGDGGGDGFGSRMRGIVVKALICAGGLLLLRRFRRSATRWDHARAVADALSGEKFSREQARRDPNNYFNLRMISCPAAETLDGFKILYFEQAFWRDPEKPFRQRLYMVKPCPKEMKCDVEVSSYAIRDVEEYRNFCDRPRDERPQPEEVVGDIAEHLTSVQLTRCKRGKHCMFEGSTPPGGFPNYWNGSLYCTSELVVHKNGEIHMCDRGYDEEGNQVWGPVSGPYVFKPAPNTTNDDMFSPLNFSAPLSVEKVEQRSQYVTSQQ